MVCVNSSALKLSRRYQLNMIANYSDFFDIEYTPDRKGYIVLKEQENILERLKERFRWTMSLSVLEAFLSQRATQALGM